jgi:hypothetical protein
MLRIKDERDQFLKDKEQVERELREKQKGFVKVE